MSKLHDEIMALVDAFGDEYERESNAGMTGAVIVAPGSARAALSTAIAELVRDAERYRYLRASYSKGLAVPSVRLGLNDEDQFDAAIDAAKEKP